MELNGESSAGPIGWRLQKEPLEHYVSSRDSDLNRYLGTNEQQYPYSSQYSSISFSHPTIDEILPDRTAESPVPTLKCMFIHFPTLYSKIRLM